ncbi:transmembrane protein 144b isoform X1 [Pygocentrus nattereri]|uniref:transmembrane protein 144b isoform X1 n=1 Tax=Pygocentrus nattereri TaxID=42514 RepID=UPI00189192F0|nr:transmembrane protein 144b isoform X1 [Pygocentrus nattereri]
MWPLHMDSMKSSGLRMSLLLITLLFGFCCLITVIAGEVGGEVVCIFSQQQGRKSSSAKDEAAGGIFTHSTYMDKIYGFLSCLVAVLLYGSNFVPVKKVNTGDGMFFQWISCAAIWVVGLVGDTLFRSSKAHPAAMLGGVIWATGNITSVPVVKCIGLGLGLLLWGASGLLIGWASSRFGLFGLDPEEVSKPVLNYCGAGLCLLSAVIFFFVKSDVQNPTSLEATPILIEERSLSDIPLPSDSWVDTISPKTKRPLGCIIAVLSGFLSGSAFVPMLYIKHHATSNSSMFAGSSQNDLDYCFAQSSGIFIASTVYFTMYCAVMKNRPRIYPRAILPGFLTGIMWGVGTYCWLLANRLLGPVVTFPIVTAGYGLVAALWGIVVFKEVKGLGNVLLFVFASCVVLTGSLLTAFSKI